ncbi:Hypothetical predicted protein, partial [Podarcis lilfordi]
NKEAFILPEGKSVIVPRPPITIPGSSGTSTPDSLPQDLEFGSDASPAFDCLFTRNASLVLWLGLTGSANLSLQGICHCRIDISPNLILRQSQLPAKRPHQGVGFAFQRQEGTRREDGSAANPSSG